MDFYGLTAQMSFLGFYLPGDRMKLHQSGDTIIVTELRPMREAPRDGTEILLMSKNNKLFNGCNYGLCGDKFIIAGIGSCEVTSFKGWLPMPIYQPEKS